MLKEMGALKQQLEDQLVEVESLALSQSDQLVQEKRKVARLQNQLSRSNSPSKLEMRRSRSNTAAEQLRIGSSGYSGALQLSECTPAVTKITPEQPKISQVNVVQRWRDRNLANLAASESIAANAPWKHSAQKQDWEAATAPPPQDPTVLHANLDVAQVEASQLPHVAGTKLAGASGNMGKTAGRKTTQEVLQHSKGTTATAWSQGTMSAERSQLDQKIAVTPAPLKREPSKRVHASLPPSSRSSTLLPRFKTARTGTTCSTFASTLRQIFSDLTEQGWGANEAATKSMQMARSISTERHSSMQITQLGNKDLPSTTIQTEKSLIYPRPSMASRAA